jgi:predicted esterase
MLPIDPDDAGPTDPFDFDLPKPTRLPVVRGRCPELTGSGTYTFGDPRTRTLPVDIYIAPNARDVPGLPAALVLYFHAIGSNSREVVMGLGQLAIDSIVKMGGVVASFSAKFCGTCDAPGDVVWYSEDDAVIDQVVACSLAQANIDTRRIHAMGFSAGAMHSLHLALVRSDYIASVVSYSGGRLDISAEPAQDPSNRVPVLLSYGRVGLDNGIVDFPALSLQWYEAFKAKGWYTMLCDHQGGHTIPADLAEQSIRFLLDHSYKFEPEMYAAGVPDPFPDYCANTPRKR